MLLRLLFIFDEFEIEGEEGVVIVAVLFSFLMLFNFFGTAASTFFERLSVLLARLDRRERKDHEKGEIDGKVCAWKKMT